MCNHVENNSFGQVAWPEFLKNGAKKLVVALDCDLSSFQTENVHSVVIDVIQAMAKAS